MVEHSRANFVVVEDKEQLDKVYYYTIISRKLNVEVAMICIQIWGVRDELEHLVEVVQWDGKVITYLIFVIFFTRAKFLDSKIYTEKRQFFALNL